MGSFVGSAGSGDVATGPDPGASRYRLSRRGIDELWKLADDEKRLESGERVSLVLALTELEQRRDKRCS